MGVSQNQLTSTHFNLFGWSFIWQLNVLYGIFRLPYWETWYRWGQIRIDWYTGIDWVRYWYRLEEGDKFEFGIHMRIKFPCNSQGLESDSLLGRAAANVLSLLASGRYVASRSLVEWSMGWIMSVGCQQQCVEMVFVLVMVFEDYCFFRLYHLVVAELMFGLIWSTQCCGEQRGPWFFDAQTQMFQFEYGIYVNGMDQICIIKSLRLHFSAFESFQGGTPSPCFDFLVAPHFWKCWRNR